MGWKYNSNQSSDLFAHELKILLSSKSIMRPKNLAITVHANQPFKGQNLQSLCIQNLPCEVKGSCGYAKNKGLGSWGEDYPRKHRNSGNAVVE